MVVDILGNYEAVLVVKNNIIKCVVIKGVSAQLHILVKDIGNDCSLGVI